MRARLLADLGCRRLIALALAVESQKGKHCRETEHAHAVAKISGT